jgi:hypothetical protein
MRYKLNKSKSKRSFSRSASRSHKKNFGSKPMRGGYRL